MIKRIAFTGLEILGVVLVVGIVVVAVEIVLRHVTPH